MGFNGGSFVKRSTNLLPNGGRGVVLAVKLAGGPHSLFTKPPVSSGAAVQIMSSRLAYTV